MPIFFEKWAYAAPLMTSSPFFHESDSSTSVITKLVQYPAAIFVILPGISISFQKPLIMSYLISCWRLETSPQFPCLAQPQEMSFPYVVTARIWSVPTAILSSRGKFGGRSFHWFSLPQAAKRPSSKRTKIACHVAPMSL